MVIAGGMTILSPLGAASCIKMKAACSVRADPMFGARQSQDRDPADRPRFLLTL